MREVVYTRKSIYGLNTKGQDAVLPSSLNSSPMFAFFMACQPCAPPPRTAMHLRAHSRAAAASAAALPHARTLSHAALPSRTHPVSCWRAGVASHHLPEGFCIFASAPKLRHTLADFAHKPRDAHNFCSSLRHYARPHDQD